MKVNNAIYKKYKGKIAAALPYGMYPSALFIALFIFGAVAFFGGSIGFVFFAIYLDNYAVIIVVILFIGCGVIFLICLFQYVKIRKIVKKWLLDCVELPAFAKLVKTDIRGFGGGLSYYTEISKIRVLFKYEDKTIAKESGEGCDIKHPLVLNKDGYSARFNSFANKNIHILYSPAYDRVFLLKFESASETEYGK